MPYKQGKLLVLFLVSSAIFHCSKGLEFFKQFADRLSENGTGFHLDIIDVIQVDEYHKSIILCVDEFIAWKGVEEWKNDTTTGEKRVKQFYKVAKKSSDHEPRIYHFNIQDLVQMSTENSELTFIPELNLYFKSKLIKITLDVISISILFLSILILAHLKSWLTVISFQWDSSSKA